MHSRNTRYRYKKEFTGQGRQPVNKRQGSQHLGIILTLPFGRLLLCTEGQCYLHKFEDSMRHKEKCYCTKKPNPQLHIF